MYAVMRTQNTVIGTDNFDISPKPHGKILQSKLTQNVTIQYLTQIMYTPIHM